MNKAYSRRSIFRWGTDLSVTFITLKELSIKLLNALLFFYSFTFFTKLMKQIIILLLVSLLIIPALSFAQSVTIGTIPASSFCVGDSITVIFTATGNFGHNNAFTLQLSDPTGGFTNGFDNIASLADTLPGVFTIKAKMPLELGGKHYRFRILAAVPYIASADNGSDIMIGNLPQIKLEYGTSLAPVAGSVKPVLVEGLKGKFTIPISGSGVYKLDSVIWDFGPDANPSTAIGKQVLNSNSWENEATYMTAGKKTVTVRAVSGGCSKTVLFPVEVFGCSPSIPRNTKVFDSSGIYLEYTPTPVNFWVNPGVNLDIEQGGGTVFAEPGSTISHCDGCILYMKKGSKYNGGGIGVTIVYDALASISYIYDDYPIGCTSLNFDYTNAPPNAAHPLGVDKIATLPINISPNPTTGILTVENIPADIIRMSVLNILGESMIELQNPNTSNSIIDISNLAHGSYYIRFVTANSVVTKKIIKQ
jgi:hypothetical protein